MDVDTEDTDMDDTRRRRPQYQPQHQHQHQHQYALLEKPGLPMSKYFCTFGMFGKNQGPKL